jgi:hypothetical protein
MRNVRVGVAGLVCSLLLAACGSGGADGQGSPVSSPSSGTSISNGVAGNPNGHEPGPVDVSTMKKGKEFDATPNFFYLKSCDHPCWLPLYPTHEYKPGHAVTDGFPSESYGKQAGDKVHVVCQVQGDMLRNDNGPMSDRWDKIPVKKERLKTTEGLEPTPDGKGYYAYGNDGWLGNTGDHGIPCP